MKLSDSWSLSVILYSSFSSVVSICIEGESSSTSDYSLGLNIYFVLAFGPTNNFFLKPSNKNCFFFNYGPNSILALVYLGLVIDFLKDLSNNWGTTLLSSESKW